eukprot:567346-Pleurochrysis_carterae.AAC.1
MNCAHAVAHARCSRHHPRVGAVSRQALRLCTLGRLLGLDLVGHGEQRHVWAARAAAFARPRRSAALCLSVKHPFGFGPVCSVEDSRLAVGTKASLGTHLLSSACLGTADSSSLLGAPTSFPTPHPTAGTAPASLRSFFRLRFSLPLRRCLRFLASPPLPPKPSALSCVSPVLSLLSRRIPLCPSLRSPRLPSFP